MNPNETLSRMLYLANKMLLPETNTTDFETYGEDLADLFIALNGWITGGGFLPVEWTDNKTGS